MSSKKNKKLMLLLVLAIVSAIYGYISAEKEITPTLNTTNSIDNIEIPAPIAHRNEQVITHTGYTVSYNQKWCLPNWVAYQLTADEVAGTVPRGDDFVPDPMVKGHSATTYDYKHSGYDRGHMAPAADMKWSETAMDESFYLSNICPQNKNLNKGDWNDLEELARKWATEYGSIYIACGPVVENNYKTIGENKVAVPKGFFKVFVRQTRNGWTTIAFYFDNVAGNRKLESYIRTIDEVEQITSIDFFSSLPDDIETAIERQTNISDWNL